MRPFDFFTLKPDAYDMRTMNGPESKGKPPPATNEPVKGKFGEDDPKKKQGDDEPGARKRKQEEEEDDDANVFKIAEPKPGEAKQSSAMQTALDSISMEMGNK